uniref:C1q domain-containing protein n=1 Tax=Magallana gigas TaxID=29159 RepID=A0A8W8MAV7_MAGGI
MYVIAFTSADQQNSSSFLSNYARHQNICHMIGYEPKCKKDCQGKVIAFHAILSTNLNNVPKGTIIKFGKVEFNDGNGYYPSTGKFTAPVDGIYSFLWTYHIKKGSSVYLCGFVNGKLRAYTGTHLNATPWQNKSAHFVAKLKRGDQFWVETYHHSAAFIHKSFTYLLDTKLMDVKV